MYRLRFADCLLRAAACSPPFPHPIDAVASTAMFTLQQTTSLKWKMPNGQMLAKEYQSRSRWLKQLNNTINGGADSHQDY